MKASTTVGAKIARHAAEPKGSMAPFYFVFFAAAGLYYPYLTLFFHARHLSGDWIGLLGAIGPAVGLLFQPFWGHLADRKRAPIKVLQLLLVLSSVTMAAVPFFPGALGLAAGLAITSAVASPLTGLADSVALRLLGPRADRYPRIRLWGSLSFALASVVSSAIWNGRALWRIFPAMAIGMLISLPMLPRRDSESALEPVGRSPAAPTDAAAEVNPSVLWRIGPYVAVLAVTFLLQLANTAHMTFLPILLVRVHTPAAYLGAPWAIAAMTEVPVFAVMPYISDRIGIRWLVLISLMLYAAQFILLSSLTAWVPVFLSQIVQGVTFTLFTGGTVILIGRLTPHNLQATGQTVFNAVGFQFSGILGSLAAGVVVQAMGVFWMYRLAAVVSVIAAVVFVITLRPWLERTSMPRAPAVPG